jgi:hypothetical protein
MSTDQLEQIAREIKDGGLVCGDCKKLCLQGNNQECSSDDRKRFPVYNQRTFQDTRTLAKINQELIRRQKVAKQIVQRNLLPNVPSGNPS